MHISYCTHTHTRGRASEVKGDRKKRGYTLRLRNKVCTECMHVTVSAVCVCVFNTAKTNRKALTQTRPGAISARLNVDVYPPPMRGACGSAYLVAASCGRMRLLCPATQRDVRPPASTASRFEHAGAAIVCGIRAECQARPVPRRLRKMWVNICFAVFAVVVVVRTNCTLNEVIFKD